MFARRSCSCCLVCVSLGVRVLLSGLFKWKLCVAVGKVVADRVVQTVAVVWFVFETVSHCQNPCRTYKRCR